MGTLSVIKCDGFSFLSHIWGNERNKRLEVKVAIGNQKIKQVRSFRCLGSLVNENGTCDAEIRSKIAMGKARFGQMRGMLTNMSMSSEIRLRVLKSYI